MQKIFRLRVSKNFGVLSQFVRYLVNNKAPTRSEGIMRFLQQRTFLCDIQNTERNAGENIIALRDATMVEFLGQGRCVSIEDMNAGVIQKLPLQIA